METNKIDLNPEATTKMRLEQAKEVFKQTIREAMVEVNEEMLDEYIEFQQSRGEPLVFLKRRSIMSSNGQTDV